MLHTLIIKNFKSIVDLTLELGRFNMFIGENGCGKTNILEALAMVAGAASNRTTNEDLFLRGTRVAMPSLIRNAFKETASSDIVDIEIQFPVADQESLRKDSYQLSYDSASDRWVDRSTDDDTIKEVKSGSESSNLTEEELTDIIALVKNHPNFIDLADKFTRKYGKEKGYGFVLQALTSLTVKIVPLIEERRILESYSIYCADTLALRGLQAQSRLEPLGIFGEGLDVAIASMASELKDELVEQARVIAWLDDIEIDRQGTRKLQGYKPGRSLSDLYFVDRFLSEQNHVFSAENANEGILHVLFYLALFLHPRAPRLMAIDNIETALNPHLLRHMVKSLAQLAVKHNRQALVTTHNPAALDGLNLHDNEQRLFIVYRNDEGHTQARRVEIKPDAKIDGSKLKLSELWMRGMLGGIPTHF